MGRGASVASCGFKDSMTDGVSEMTAVGMSESIGPSFASLGGRTGALRSGAGLGDRAALGAGAAAGRGGGAAGCGMSERRREADSTLDSGAVAGAGGDGA